ncbi:hypothetical protein COT86_01065 [Candidatus Collierbacteria bacterium CG10_big_fil_rev_8_21_14_0_10_43_36]|uniref:Uncharacterized protein n=3 Tax=Candidatus Collieribacteriota TaxID=1752725 RepID=A0A2H0DV95_9BACT|nr:MAG: hypothetical protein COW83_00790 [Candidatus Collierbacteria bacterium CG22_combo_CG10-13_8_21_14_all_43_12]PIR99973.1 MAG: hypothetical protein COT86_01065 [Candidatus Collierbacteria bacterium CG10_big_fil_rev_8_21_14_0_10_43_36]PIZ24417.1 MAG: hypothetical protein COY48_03040 [Candidatus Collierbacteria bacterium CG_4_10_14_0_8_um_filter_43_86]PJB48403.1 MAG: hypothetical protein CO104_01370 [Candidatus Collierbacteria bacterium CG_4_9_14_3_um_filter_43_16]
MNVSVAVVKISEKSIISNSLPDGYAVSGYGPLYGVIALAAGGVTCAEVRIENGEIVYFFKTEGYPGFWAEKFKQELWVKYPSLKW